MAFFELSKKKTKMIWNESTKRFIGKNKETSTQFLDDSRIQSLKVNGSCDLLMTREEGGR
jgi:hypothetical protein